LSIFFPSLPILGFFSPQLPGGNERQASLRAVLGQKTDALSAAKAGRFLGF